MYQYFFHFSENQKPDEAKVETPVIAKKEHEKVCFVSNQKTTNDFKESKSDPKPKSNQKSSEDKQVNIDNEDFKKSKSEIC